MMQHWLAGTLAHVAFGHDNRVSEVVSEAFAAAVSMQRRVMG